MRHFKCIISLHTKILYSCSKDGNNKELISNIPAMSVTCDAGNSYVLAKESGEEMVLPKSH